MTQVDGTYLPDWVTYEEITRTLSGIPNDNSTTLRVTVAADDRRGGSTSQTFDLVVTEYTGDRNILPLIIVGSLLALFILGIIAVMCFKNV